MGAPDITSGFHPIAVWGRELRLVSRLLIATHFHRVAHPSIFTGDRHRICLAATVEARPVVQRVVGARAHLVSFHLLAMSSAKPKTRARKSLRRDLRGRKILALQLAVEAGNTTPQSSKPIPAPDAEEESPKG